jgi:putative acetyltransferase
MSVTVRPLVPEDGRVAAEIFFDAVHNGTADLYSVEQRIAWAGDAPNPSDWMQAFETSTGFAAEIEGAMVGFMTLDSDGYIDLAFVRTACTGLGVGRMLYHQVEARARSERLAVLTTQASRKAWPFFLRMGWQTDCEQSVEKRGVWLTNFKMSKRVTQD